MPERRKCEARSRRHHELQIKRQRQAADECEMVSVEPFREQFIWLRDTKQISTSDLCYRMGWIYRPNPERLRAERRRPNAVKPDTSHAQRVLGLRRRGGCQYDKQFITYTLAIRLADALGMDPHEAGI